MRVAGDVMGKFLQKYGQVIFGLVVTGVALWLLFRTVNFAELGSALAAANYWWVIPSVVVMVFSILARAKRWQVLLEDKLGLLELFWITNIGYLLSNVLPLRLGELGRMWLASRDGRVPFMQAASTGILERLVDTLTVVLMMVMIFPFLPQQGVIVQASTGIAIVAVVGVVGLFVAALLRDWVLTVIHATVGRINARLGTLLAGQVDVFLSAINASRKGNRLWLALFWTVVIWVTTGITSQFMMWAFVPDAPFYMGVFAFNAVVLGLALPSSPSGLGLFEAVAVAALLLFNVPEATALAWAVVFHILNFVLIALFGVIGLGAERVTLGEVARSAQGMMKAVRGDAAQVDGP